MPPQEKMTLYEEDLCDELASRAMQAIIIQDQAGTMTWNGVADGAYNAAEAMLRERRKRKKE